jgi:hypothetical protein
MYTIAISPACSKRTRKPSELRCQARRLLSQELISSANDGVSGINVHFRDCASAIGQYPPYIFLDFPMSNTGQARLKVLTSALDASPRALRRDECGDFAISGKLGRIMSDGAGFLLYVVTGESSRRWHNVKQRLSFCRVTQDGDDEGCLSLNRLPTPAEAGLVRDALGIRRKRHLSPEALSALFIAKVVDKSASVGPTFAECPSR